MTHQEKRTADLIEMMSFAMLNLRENPACGTAVAEYFRELASPAKRRRPKVFSSNNS